MQIKCPFKNYATAPNMYDDDWIRYIQKKEKEHGNTVTWKDAKQILKQVICVSRAAQIKYNEAKKEGASEYDLEKIKKGIFVVRDRKTGMLKGRTRPKRESIGLERNSKHPVDTLRSRHDSARAAYLSDFLEGIKAREIAAGNECTNCRAKEILETGRKNGWLKFHSVTKTWRGERAPKPDKDEIKQLKSALNLTVVQRKYWDLFGDMPPLWFSYWIKPYECEVTKWTIAHALELGEEIDAVEAVRRYKGSWKCSEIKSKQPLWKDPATGKACGRNCYIPGMLRQMPKLERGSLKFLEWFDAEMSAVGEPEVVLEVGVKCGDVIVLKSQENPLSSDSERVEYIGVDAQATEIKESQERERKAQEAIERKKSASKFSENQPNLREWFERLVDPDSDIAKAICSMPLFNGNPEAENDEDPIWGPAAWLAKQNIQLNKAALRKVILNTCDAC
jgi:hypothetical protein